MGALNIIIGGVPQVIANSVTRNRVFAKPANPAVTTSGTLVMAGVGLLGGSTTKMGITPTGTGIVRIIVKGEFNNNTAGVNVAVGLRFGTTTAPANGDAVTGTTADVDVTYTSDLNTKREFVKMANVTGLTIGTAVWFDLAFSTSSGADAAALVNIAADIEELN